MAIKIEENKKTLARLYKTGDILRYRDHSSYYLLCEKNGEGWFRWVLLGKANDAPRTSGGDYFDFNGKRDYYVPFDGTITLTPESE